jgi:hypothetical protein
MTAPQSEGASLLSEEEVQRIKQEEKLRSEVRAALAPAKPTGFPNKLWDALNSTFGIWFLTAFVVTGLGSLASKWYEEVREKEQKQEAQLLEERRKSEANYVAERQKKETYERLTLEISYRYSSALAGLRDAAERHGEARNRTTHSAISYAIQPLTRPTSLSQPPLFKEYEAYSGLALIAELRRHTGQGEANMLKEILARTGALLHQISYNKAGTAFSARTAATALVERMRNPKWDNGFAYTDCRSDNPFC